MKPQMNIECKYDPSDKSFFFSSSTTGKVSVNMTELQAHRQVNVMRQLGLTVDVRCKMYSIKEGKV